VAGIDCQGLQLQNTLKSQVVFEGVGLHSGASARIVLHPAKPDHGIWFRRSDIELGDALIPALWNQVDRSPLCTRLHNDSGVSVSTVEHIMAALAGCGIHNALIDIDGPEVPILDGSAAPFMRGIMRKGVHKQDAPLRAIEILLPVSVEQDGARATLLPSDRLEISFSIDFTDGAIGRQSKTLDMRNGAFARELCDSRTFCRQADVDEMHENGLALGGTLENAVVVDGDDVLSPGGFRHEDEAVRHKMLDALGDLALAGAPILGRYEGNRAGHSLTNTLLRALFATPGAFRVVECNAEMAARLPGQGLVWAEIPKVA
jgi:UDP-3-O-[3-hydroxymyristoyl] N-acetylglucosamine deacetylase